MNNGQIEETGTNSNATGHVSWQDQRMIDLWEALMTHVALIEHANPVYLPSLANDLRAAAAVIEPMTEGWSSQ